MKSRLFLQKNIILILFCFTLCISGCSQKESVDDANSKDIISQTQTAAPTETPQQPDSMPDQQAKATQTPDITPEPQEEATQTTGITPEPQAKAAQTPDIAPKLQAKAAQTPDTTPELQSNIIQTPDSAVTPQEVISSTPEPTVTPQSKIPQTPMPTVTDDDGKKVTVIVSGIELAFDGQQPLAKDGEVFVPIYGVFEKLDGANGSKDAPFTVKWDEATHIATIKNAWYSTDAQAQIINGEYMLPLMKIADAIDATALWDKAANTVSIFYESLILVS